MSGKTERVKGVVFSPLRQKQPVGWDYGAIYTDGGSHHSPALLSKRQVWQVVEGRREGGEAGWLEQISCWHRLSMTKRWELANIFCGVCASKQGEHAWVTLVKRRVIWRVCWRGRKNHSRKISVTAKRFSHGLTNMPVKSLSECGEEQPNACAVDSALKYVFVLSPRLLI